MFSGTMVAPGIAFGPALVWAPRTEPVQLRQVAAAAAGTELQRLEHALRGVRRELEEIAGRVAVSVGESAAAIFRAHRMILGDLELLETVRRRIREDHLAAESAMAASIEVYARRLAASGGKYLSTRAEDLYDLRDRVLMQLRYDDPHRGVRLERGCVLVAEKLAAADVMSLDRSHLRALVIAQSGSTSHAAILASTLGIPVVVGVPRLVGYVRTGECVIVDGNHGHIVVNPTPLALREYRTRRALFDQFCRELAGLRDTPAITPDGHCIRLSANIGLAEEIPTALAQGAERIGLVRTELFYLAHDGAPTEDEQYAFYARIVDAMAGRSVTFRTFDLGGDKVSPEPVAPEPNPMLGCRGIRVLTERRDLFIDQIRALLRASCHGPIEVMFPLITSLAEFQDTLRLVTLVQTQMRAQQQPFDERVRFGCMIETPAAAMIPDILASEAEFLSIGSNDLIQYTVAADRSNLRVAYMYEPLHLAVLRMMRRIICAAHRRKRPVRLCGEMAADPIYTIILLGLGVDELSMPPMMIPAIKQIIRSVRWSEARELALGALRERRAKDVQAYLERMMASRFPTMMNIYGPKEDPENPAAVRTLTTPQCVPDNRSP